MIVSSQQQKVEILNTQVYTSSSKKLTTDASRFFYPFLAIRKRAFCPDPIGYRALRN